MINTKSIEEARRSLKKESVPRVILAQDDEFNRKIIELGGFDIILSLESGNRKNKIRQIDSGFNHVLAKIAQKKAIAIGINLEEIRKLEPKSKAERIAKIKQNVKLCRKSGVKIAIKSNSLGIAKDFLHGLNASGRQIKQAIVF